MKATPKILLFAFLVVPSVVSAQEKKDPSIDWQKWLAEIRLEFAGSPLPALQQTRIDRAYFSLNEDDPASPPILNFQGVALRTALDDEKAMKATVQKALGKLLLPGVQYQIKIDEIAFHESPIYLLQEAVLRAFQNDATFNNFFERATYAADGTLQLHVICLRFDGSTDSKLEKFLGGHPLPADLTRLPPGKMAKGPKVLRRDYDWLGKRIALQRQFAGHVDPFLQRTRIDDAHLRYTKDRKEISFQVRGASIHPSGLVPEAERIRRLKSHLSNVIPNVTYSTNVGDIVQLNNPSLSWQDEAAAQASRDGIFFHLGRFDADGRLRVDIQIADETHKKAAIDITAMKPTPAALPLDEKSLTFRDWPWNQILPEAQKRLAQGDFLQQRTRVDRLFLKYDEPTLGIPYLHAQGVSLHPTEIEAPQKLRERLEPQFIDLVPTNLDHKRNMAGIQFLESPIYALQTEAIDRSQDGMLFANARYDELGRLHMNIVVGAAPQRAVVSQIVAGARFDEGVIRAKSAKAQPIVHITEIPWSEILRQKQGWLSHHNETLLRKSRLDRGFFSYPKSKVGPDLNLAIVGLYPQKDELTVRLTKRFETYAQVTLGDVLRAGPIRVIPTIQNLENPAKIVQAKIPEVFPLDGVRLDDASFDKDGKLVLHGLWVNNKQQVALDRFVRETLTPAYPALKYGTNFGPMQDADTPALLLKMRNWIANQNDIDEVWLERFYFDGTGKTRISGFSTHPKDKAKADQGLPRFLPRFDSQELPPLEPGAKEKSAPKPVLFEVSFLQDPKGDEPIVLDLLPSISRHLRESIPKVAACDGLRIDRCFYDVTGIFRIEGLADHANHAEELRTFLESEQVKFDPKRQLAKGWAEGRQTVIPIRPMRVSLEENLPSLEMFDGFTITRIYHDPNNQLVFVGHAVGDPDGKSLATKLARLLETHPRWRLRTTFGVAVEIPDRRPPDVELANKLMYRALHLLQVNIGEASVDPMTPACIGWMSHAWPFNPKLARALPTDRDYVEAAKNLDTALLHHPKSVLAWYLRGYILQTTGRVDLSLRDFRRMVAMENDDPELRHARILALELVQGSLRQSALRIERRAQIEVGDEWTLRVLRESPVAPDSVPR